MYQHYFGLAEAPFSIAPDPRYLYLSERHQEALAHLLYGVNGEGGFVLLTGEVGAGKTTVCRCLLEQIPESCDIAFIFNPKLTVEELLSTICTEFGIAVPERNTSIKVFIDCINAYLLDAHARGRHTVLIIDEAQNLSADVLEQMRLLTNLETNQRKLLQIILLGQPELAAMLARPELRQLAQRVVARYHLGPLAKREVSAYVQHRLTVSGAQRSLFPVSLMSRLYRLTGGVPRLINVVCDRALLGVYVQGKERVDRKTLRQAAREVLPQTGLGSARVKERWALAAGITLLGGGVLALAMYQQDWRTENTNVAGSKKAVVPVKLDVPAVPPITTPKMLAEPHEPDLSLSTQLEWPANEARTASETLTYTALFRTWGVDYQGTNPCQYAATLGLRCKAGRGGLDDVRKTNRPAVLRLRDDRGQGFHALLNALDDKSASFVVGSETKRVALAALGTQWSGDYVLLWRGPPDKTEAIRAGSRGPAVAWLAQQLAQTQGTSVDADNRIVLDDVLMQQVRAFQLAQGLTPDGAVGPQTLLRLSAVADRTAPTLTRK